MKTTIDAPKAPPKAPPKKTAKPARLNPLELAFAGGIALLFLVLRWEYARRQSWGSDEPQHLHVVWAWATGQLPYRDVFDNHSPLFHFLCSPFFAWLGERPDIMAPMRFLLAPLFALSLWCVYKLGSRAFSKRAGLWAAILTGAFPPFFLKMGEFRTDVLWTTLWLVTLVVLTHGTLTRQRLFWAGLTLGATFCVSMKSLLFLITLLFAGAIVLGTQRLIGQRCSSLWTRETAFNSGAAVAGFLIMPLLVLAFFGWQGALGPLYYGIVEHNTVPGAHKISTLLKRLIEFPNLLLLIAIPAGAAVAARRAPASVPPKNRLFLLLVAGLFYPLLCGFWPMITPQDFMPWYPVAILCATPAILWATGRTGRWLPPLLILALLVLLEFNWMFSKQPPFKREQIKRYEDIAQALALTRPGEFLMDSKGETIFRPRPYYYVFETLTRKRLKLGLLPDDLPQRLIETGTAVIRPSDRMTEASRQFIENNYVPVSKLSVLGKFLTPGATADIRFQITIPAEYTLVGKEGAISATLDGTPFSGSRWIGAGEHLLQVKLPEAQDLALVWSRAVNLGFSPFHKPPLLYKKRGSHR